MSAQSGTLWIGFTGLLLLMAAIAVDSAWSLHSFALASTALRRESHERDALLNQLRPDVHNSGTVMRDYLLELDDARAATQREDLERARDGAEGTLRAYEQKLPETERAAFKDLRASVESYWKSLVPVLQWSALIRRDKGEAYLRNVIIPRRAEVVQLTRQATALNERDLIAAEDRLRAIRSRFGQRVTAISMTALFLGFILAAITIRRMQHLEGQAEARYREANDAHLELQRLSGRLVHVQEEERRNLSRELHDDIGQTMSAMLVELRGLETATNNKARWEHLDSVRRMAEDSIAKVRNMALMLRPSMLDDLGLIPALNWQAREITRRTGLKVKMIAGEITEDLPDPHRTCVYRVVQEALNNCAKHSQATQVRVSVRQDQDGSRCQCRMMEPDSIRARRKVWAC